MLITHPNHLHNMNDSSFFKDKAILTHMNATVDVVNDYVLNLILGKWKTYLSLDSPYHATSNFDILDDVNFWT